MKGAIMKAGQMVSFIADGLPPEAQAALASAAGRRAADGARAWPRRSSGRSSAPTPSASSSTGTRCRWRRRPSARSTGPSCRDGRVVAVKVQYPGVDKAIKGDLDNAELLYGLFAAFALKNLDVQALVDELRARMGDELDYRLEAGAPDASSPTATAATRSSPCPTSCPSARRRRVLTSEWVDGHAAGPSSSRPPPPEAPASGRPRSCSASPRARSTTHRVFNGDPHPGNYRFHADGTVTFLDFGLVKRWRTAELERADPRPRPAAGRGRRPARSQRMVRRPASCDPTTASTPSTSASTCSSPYVPYLTEEFTFTRAWTSETLAQLARRAGPVRRRDRRAQHAAVVRHPRPGRVGHVGPARPARGPQPWRAILAEYRHGGPPATALGEEERAWAAGRAGAGELVALVAGAMTMKKNSTGTITATSTATTMARATTRTMGSTAGEASAG